MNDTTRWILFGVGAVVLIGLTILRLGMRGRGRSGIYLVLRILVAVIAVGILAWRYFAQH